MEIDPPAPDRRVYPVEEFNRRLRSYVRRVRNVWVEGEIAELRRNDAWATVFLTLKGSSGATLSVQITRARFDRLALGLAEGEQIMAFGEVDLYEQRGSLVFRATTFERSGAGSLLAQLERLKASLAAEGLFDERRKRPLPRFPATIGLLTGADAAARGDVVAALAARFPSVRLVVCETRVQGDRAPAAIVAGLGALAADPRVEVVVVARGGGSLEDLLPFSDERVVRAVAASRVPVVSAVGHEQDTPLCDLAADVRAATPTAAARLVVPDAGQVREALDGSLARLTRALRTRSTRDQERLDTRHSRLHRGLATVVARDRALLGRSHERLRSATPRLLERRRATLDASGLRLQALAPAATLARGYAIVRSEGRALRSAESVATGASLDVELADGSLHAVVDEVRL